MSSWVAISIDFKKAMDQADKLDAIANDLNKISSSEFENILQVVNSNWKGENASLYLDKGDKLQDNMSKTAKNIKSIAEEIRKVATNIYNSEMAAVAIAQTRNS